MTGKAKLGLRGLREKLHDTVPVETFQPVGDIRRRPRGRRNVSSKGMLRRLPPTPFGLGLRLPRLGIAIGEGIAPSETFRRLRGLPWGVVDGLERLYRNDVAG